MFSNLVTITIENNPISDNCKYLRQFVTYRFSSVRYFNKTPIDYQDLQKAKQVFSVFDKILQIPGQLNGKKREGVRGLGNSSRTVADKIVEHALTVRRNTKEFERVWSELCQDMMIH